MNRTTIDFGIDLGTTNSVIAVFDGTNVVVFKNNEGDELTPSAVSINKKGTLYVGKQAKNQLLLDPANAFSEFKLQMGSNYKFVFERTGKSLTAPELSAEVLKSLKGDVMQKIGEEINGAVVTIPAAFETPQCQATEEAGDLAGLKDSPLLPEPVAAALAYGFQSSAENVFWLVYDFGGGTFDAALMQVRDGSITVVNHMGDNHLGGKLIDWEIVDKIFAPALREEYKLGDFNRGNREWQAAYAKLKNAAEEAKIRVSRRESEEVLVPNLGTDDSGESMELDIELRKKDVEALAKPFILKTIKLCEQVLQDKGLNPENIEKVVLVGGTTLIPYVRKMLQDPKEGLGIELEFSLDPLTVVARGAAIFAGTQQLKVDKSAVKTGQYLLELDYESVGKDREIDLFGKIENANGQSFSGYTIEFIEEGKEGWRSGNVPLRQNGSFDVLLRAFEGRKNTFRIELMSPQGAIQETIPASISYSFGLALNDLPLIYSLGIALANNSVARYFDKGTPLPARKIQSFRTAKEIQPGQENSSIKIPFIEGENLQRADRNSMIGYLEIPASKVRRRLPAGSEVEVTIDISSSRLIRTEAFIPDIDMEFEKVLNLGKEQADTEKLRKEFKQEKQRLESLQEKANTFKDDQADDLLGEINDQNMVSQVESALLAADQDRDAGDKSLKNLTQLKQKLDDIEEKLEWPSQLAQTRGRLEWCRKIVEQFGKEEDLGRFQALEAELEMVIEERDLDGLKNKEEQIDIFGHGILQEQPGFWIAMLENLEKDRSELTDQSRANQLFAQGRQAIQKEDWETLKENVRSLFELIPADKQTALTGGLGSDIMR